MWANTLATWCEDLTYLKRPWCWERLKAGGEGDNRGWDGWMASSTQYTWVWASSGSWWWTVKPGVLQSMELQRVGHDWATEVKWAELVAQLVKNSPVMQEIPVQFLGQEDPLEKGTATHSSILGWRIPWTVYSMGSQRVRHDWVTHFSFPFTECSSLFYTVGPSCLSVLHTGVCICCLSLPLPPNATLFSTSVSVS